MAKEIITSPWIDKWQTYFRKEDGRKNREKVAKAFHKFWSDSNEDILWVEGKVLLGGKVYGHERFDDGSDILTSNIVSLERIERGDNNGIPHDLIRVTTQSGSRYHFYTDDYSVNMFMLLGDLTHVGKLNKKDDYYLKRSLRGRNLF